MKHFVYTLCLCILCQLLDAAPANPKWTTLRQNDGYTLTYHRLGDEFMHWYETEDAYTIIKNSKGEFEYAIIDEQSQNLIPSGVLAHNADLRSNNEWQLLSTIGTRAVRLSSRMKQGRDRLEDFSKSTPSINSISTVGQQRRFILLVDYQDVKFSGHTNYPNGLKEAFDSLLNSKEYTHLGATGSVRKYYYDNSNGQLDMTCDVIGPVTLPKTQAYYGTNDPNGNDGRPQEMIADALKALDQQGFDFTQYITIDLPNAISTFHVIYAGYGEEAADGPEEAIWAHAWSLKSPVTYDGVTLKNYSCSPELRGSKGTDITSIGVVAHELGHTFGLFDLYDTDLASNGEALGIVDWGLMANGSWVNNGMTPPYLSAWEREFLKWHTPANLGDSTYCKLKIAPMNDTLKSYYFSTKTNGERYYLEVRELKKWDAFLPGAGLLIYHIDRSSAYLANWTNNKVNAYSAHECFRIKTPNNDFSGKDADDAWPTNTKTEFTDQSIPSAQSWAGVNSEKPIRNIKREANGFISLEVGNPPTNPTLPQYTVSATATSGGQVTPVSQKVDSAKSCTITIQADASFEIQKIEINNKRTITIEKGTLNYAFTFLNVRGDSALKAYFVEIGEVVPSYKVTAQANTGGQVSPQSVQVDSGQSVNIVITANAFYKIEKLVINEQRTVTFSEEVFNNTFTFSNVRGDSSLKAFFVPLEVEADEFTLAITTGVGGMSTPTGSLVLDAGATKEIVILANEDYCIDSIIEDTIITRYANCIGYKKYTTQAIRADKNLRIEFRSLSSGIANTIDQAFKLYPNPCRYILNVEWSHNEPVVLSIHDLSGHKVYQQELPAGVRYTQVDVSHLPSGAYMLRLGTQVQVWIKN